MAKSKRPVRGTAKRAQGNLAQKDLREIAARYIEARNALVRAGRTLHDHIGSSLSATGVQLQLLRMDHPPIQTKVDETIRMLDEALDRVRSLSREIGSSPAHRGGLKQALRRLSEDISIRCNVSLEYSATLTLPPEIDVAFYDVALSAIEEALRQVATRVDISVRGTGPVILRITDDGRRTGRARALSIARLLAEEQGLTFECSTGKSTIVSISYAVRRPSRG